MQRNLSILLILLFLPLRALPVNYYFDATLGKDTARINSINTPWQTISKLNKIFSTLKPGDSILFKRGETWSGEVGGTIIVKKSGSALFPIVISAYGSGNKPVISGYKELTFTGFAGENIYSSNELLKVSSLNLITVNDVVTGMGRYPNANEANGGYLTVDSHKGLTQITDSALSDTPNWTGAILVRRAENWKIDRKLITGHSGNSITYLNTDSLYPAIDKFGYFIQNDSIALDVDNEWFYSPSGILKMYHTGGAPVKVKASNVSGLLRSSGFSNVIVDNIYFKGANDTAIYLTNGRNFTIQHCVVNGAWTGIMTDADSTTLVYDSVVNCLNNGILNFLESHHAVIAYNYVCNIHPIAGAGGDRDADGTGILTRSDNTIIRHNVVKNVGLGGIWFYRKDSVVIEYNLVDTFNTIKHDIGGIYTFDGTAEHNSSGRKIRYNIVLNGIGAGFGTDDSTRSRAYGVYCDLGSFQGDIENNTVANCRGGIFTNYASDWHIRYNTLYNNSSNAIQINHPGDIGRFPRNYIVTGNIMWATKLTQRLLWVSDFNVKDDIDLIGIIDSNYYIRPLGDTEIILDYQKKVRSLPSWQSAHSSVNYDIHSSLSPVSFSSKASQDSNVRFEYNATDTDKIIDLNGQNYFSADKVRYFGSMLLKPFTSVILFKDTNTFLNPLADSYVRDSLAKNNNYGAADSLLIEKNLSAGNGYAYLKFSLAGLNNILSAKLLVFGKNKIHGRTARVAVFGVKDNSWTETEITWSNKPPPGSAALDSADVTDTEKYYEFDVSKFVKSQFLKDSLVSFRVRNTDTTAALVIFNSKEKKQNPPQLVIAKAPINEPLAASYVRASVQKKITLEQAKAFR